MDRYTLMCSKLTQLQEEWKPVLGDDTTGRTGFGVKTLVSLEDISWINRNRSENFYLPSLEDLIAMLEEINILWEIRKEFATTKNSIEYWYCAINCNNEYTGNIPKIALLKLAAYERWGLTWSDEKETWEDRK